MKKIPILLFPVLFLIASLISLSSNAQTCNQPLPTNGCSCIYFCTFTATASGCNIALNWSTQTEPTVSSSFEIWRTSDATNYIKIATVNGNPGSQLPKNYTYTDNNPYNPNGNVQYYIKLISSGSLVLQTVIRNVTLSKTTCPGSLPASLCGTGNPVMVGFVSNLPVGGTSQLSLSGASAQPIEWTSSNQSIATVSPTGLVTAVALGTVTITGKYVVCNKSVAQVLTVTPPPYSINPNACNGIYTTTPLYGTAGDVVVLKLSFGGFVNWNGIGTGGAGASIFLVSGSQSSTAQTAHTFTSFGFNISTQITITMPSSSTLINTSVIVNNSSTMLSSTATLSVVSVNGVTKNSSGVVCGGNSQGAW